MINIPSQGAATPVGYSRSPHSSRPCVRVLEALVPRQSDEEEDDDFLLDRQEVRVTASLTKYGNRSAERTAILYTGARLLSYVQLGKIYSSVRIYMCLL